MKAKQKKPRHRRTDGVPFGVIVGQNVRKLRKEAGVTQAELADAANMAHSHVGLIERGMRPRVEGETLLRLAAALNVSAQSLAFDPDCVPPAEESADG